MRKDKNKKKMGMLRSILAVGLLLGSSAAFAQSQVTGVITDTNGEPIIGATVMEEGTQNGTLTDVDGRYSLTPTKQNARLKVRYLGYNEQVIKPGQNVVLEEDVTALNEVVVVGYGTMRRKDVTSSITTIDAKDLNTGVFTDPAELLQGKVAGLMVTTTGDPNGEPSITLRGASSLRTSDGAMSPYYVIDGIPGVDISMVSPDDIETIDVLRDATATAIYGSKAANGVIIITTKSGKYGAERTNVSYNAYVAFDKVANTLDMASASDLREYAANNGLTLATDGGANTDWQDEVLRTGVSHRHNLSISGGAKKTTYMASVSYRNRQGVVENNSNNRLNLNSLVSTKILKDHLEVSAGIKHVRSNITGIQNASEGASVLDAVNYYSPTLAVTNADGSWTSGNGSQNYNPMSLINEDTSKSFFKRTQFIGKATVNIIKGLTWTANYSYTDYQRTNSYYHSHDSQLASAQGMNGVANRSTYFGSNHNFETYGNYDVTINKRHKLSIMAGYSWEEKQSNDGFGLTVHDFYDDAVKYYNLTYGSTVDAGSWESGTKETIRNISFYGRASYSFNSKYIVQATIRHDGSSVFGSGHQWGTFPSASAAWNITEEKWMRDQNIFHNLKLRAGYGVSGNSLGFGAYTATATYGTTDTYFTYDGTSWRTLSATKNANADLKWEKTGMFNIGLDFAFLKGRINGSVEWYHKKTKDLIWDYPVSTNIYPYSTIAANVGEITNKGIEITLNAEAVRTKNFSWNTTLILSHNKNCVDRLSNELYSTGTFSQGDPMIAGVSSEGWTQRIMEGEALGTFYTYEFAGYNEDGISTYYVHDEETGERTGEVTTAPEYKDRTITGCAQPKLQLGWNNTFTYKNWSLTAFFTGTFGNQIYNGLRAQYTSPSLFTTGRNVLKEFIYERPATDTSSNIPSDKFIEDGDYFRLSSLTLGYTFTNLKDWMQSINVYFTCNNVFTITGYDGLDPEVNLGGIDPGIEYRWSNYPHTRTFLIGAKFNF